MLPSFSYIFVGVPSRTAAAPLVGMAVVYVVTMPNYVVTMPNDVGVGG